MQESGTVFLAAGPKDPRDMPQSSLALERARSRLPRSPCCGHSTAVPGARRKAVGKEVGRSSVRCSCGTGGEPSKPAGDASWEQDTAIVRQPDSIDPRHGGGWGTRPSGISQGPWPGLDGAGNDRAPWRLMAATDDRFQR